MNRQNTLLAGVALLLCAAGKPTSETLVVPVDAKIAGQAEGHPASFRMMANGVSYPVLNPALASTLALSGGWLTAHMQVGPVMLKGQTGVIHLTVGGTEGKRRILWFDRPIAPDADGALGPGAVPQPIVTFRLRAAVPGERDVILPLIESDNAMGTQMAVGGQTIFVQWDLARPATLATAAAGQVLAATYQGRLEGSAARMMIRFDVERPVRVLALGAPLTIGPVVLRRVTMRTADYGNSSGIADAEATDDGEIVVSAKSKLHPSYRLVIGADDMATCSSITFDKAAKRIVLRCATATG